MHWTILSLLFLL